MWFQLHGKLGMYNSEQQSCPRHRVARTWARLPAQGYALLLASVVVADAVAAAAVSSHGSDSPHMGKPQDRALLVQMWQQHDIIPGAFVHLP